MSRTPVTAEGASAPARRRSLIRTLGALGVSAALALGSTALAAPAAYAAPDLVVTNPVEGATLSPFVPTFDGEGVNAGDTVAITYVNGAGETSSATRFTSAPVIGANLLWSAPTNFSDLAPDQTAVAVTFTEQGSGGATVGTPVVRNITFSAPPNPANPFNVTSPGVGTTVDTPTPTITGTANPGEQITVSVANIDFTTFVAGTGTVDGDGNFSFALDLGEVVQDADGATTVGLNVVRAAADGSALADDTRRVSINYAPPVRVLAVDTPAEGAVVGPIVPSFSGSGINAGDTIEITYENGAGETQSATRFIGDIVVEDDFTWFAPTNFEDLAPDQTDITVTVTERDAAGAVVGVPVVRTFEFSSPPNPANPFNVTSPGSGSTVTTYTPTITGTANPGEIITVSVANIDFTTFVAGTGTVDADGNFSFPLDLSRVVQDADGSTSVGLNTVRTAADGTALPDDTRAPLIFFEPVGPAPFVPNEPSISIVPESVTLADATNPEKGVLVTATGFDQNEAVALTLTAPDGSIVEFTAEEIAALGTADETGTFAAPVFLIGNAPLGVYTVTVTGPDSGVVLTDSFTVVANPVLPTGSGNGGTLASTGAEAVAPVGFAAAMLLAGGILMLIRRRSLTGVDAH